MPEIKYRISCPDGAKRGLFETAQMLGMSRDGFYKRYLNYLDGKITKAELFKPKECKETKIAKCLNCKLPKCKYD